MSKIFYDKLVALEHIEKEIDKLVDTKEEKEELWHIIDEYVHHKVLGCIMKNLPQHHHEEFLKSFSETPHDENHWKYLKEKIPADIESFLKEELQLVGHEIMGLLTSGRTSKKKKTSKK